MNDRRGTKGTVVLVHRYFAPDTPPYASILATIAGDLASRGHDVRVLTCQPSYNRSVVRRAPAREITDDGVHVRRFPVFDDRRSAVLKVVNLVWFCLRIATARRELRGARVIMAATTPPVVVALLCSWIAQSRGAAFVYHKQDIWPEVSMAGGGRLGVVGRLLRRIDHGTDARATHVVVLSDDMARTVTCRGPLATEPMVINNFDPWPIAADPWASALNRCEGPRPLTLVFAGNLGAFQGLGVVLETVRATEHDDIDWHFFGEGSLKPLLDEMASHENVHVHGHCSPEEVAAFVREQADLGVVSLNPGVIAAAYPSKTMTYLRNGCPLVTFVEADSELARMVAAEGIGLTASPDSALEAARQLRALAQSPGDLRGARVRARAVYESRFAKGRALTTWSELVLAAAGAAR